MCVDRIQQLAEDQVRMMSFHDIPWNHNSMVEEHHVVSDAVIGRIVKIAL